MTYPTRKPTHAYHAGRRKPSGKVPIHKPYLMEKFQAAKKRVQKWFAQETHETETEYTANGKKITQRRTRILTHEITTFYGD